MNGINNSRTCGAFANRPGGSASRRPNLDDIPCHVITSVAFGMMLGRPNEFHHLSTRSSIPLPLDTTPPLSLFVAGLEDGRPNHGVARRSAMNSTRCGNGHSRRG